MRGFALPRIVTAVVLSVGIALVAVGNASPARAKRPAKAVAAPGAPSPAQKVAAKQHFNAAQALFNAGDYDKAMVEYQAAYAAWPLDGFNFNIAQCHRNLGHTADAIDYFDRYLKSPSSAKNRGEVELVLAELRQKKAQEDAALGGGAKPEGETPVAVAAVAPAKPEATTEPAKPEPAKTEPAKPAAPEKTELASATHTATEQKPVEEKVTPPVEARPAEAKPAVPEAAMKETPAEDKPVYKRGWFWATAGAAFVVVGGAVTVAALASQRLPSGSLGTTDWR